MGVDEWMGFPEREMTKTNQLKCRNVGQSKFKSKSTYM